MTIDVTLPQLLRRNAERMPNRTALREKDRGIWQPYSWRRYWEEVRDLALGLAAQGFAPGDKLSVIGENRPRLYFAQLAAMSLGGIAVPVYQDAIATELAFVLDHAESSVVVAEDQEQVDKILSLREQLPHLKLLVYDDPRGLRNYAEPILQSFEAVSYAGELGFAVKPPLDAGASSGWPELCRAGSAVGSGKFGTPCARMHFANASGLGLGVDLVVLCAVVVVLVCAMLPPVELVCAMLLPDAMLLVCANLALEELPLQAAISAAAITAASSAPTARVSLTGLRFRTGACCTGRQVSSR